MGLIFFNKLSYLRVNKSCCQAEIYRLKSLLRPTSVAGQKAPLVSNTPNRPPSKHWLVEVKQSHSMIQTEEQHRLSRKSLESQCRQLEPYAIQLSKFVKYTLKDV